MADFPVVIQSQLVANEASPGASDDPRAAAALAAPLGLGDAIDCHENRAILVHRTKTSGLRMAAGMDHFVDGPDGIETSIEACAGRGPLPGHAPTSPRRARCGWSSCSATDGRRQRSAPALRDQVAAARRGGAPSSAGRACCADQRAYLDDFWARSDVELEGDAELQQAVRFALFHTLQAGARGEQRAIAAKGLTGPGYDGHTFWDTEMFVLPVLTYTAPTAAADALRWRQSTLDLARARARTLGLRGAAFPWRTIGGQECSSYWPAGTAAFHINADIADAVAATWPRRGDEEFERESAVWSCWSRRPGCGARWVTTTPRATSASTA